jgi:NTE family protein
VGDLRKIVLAACLARAVLWGPAMAEPQDTGKRPKIGVALAGGAALGLAHIGVLEWLEEHRIPVDYVAGTSMGALVGALHATGMTASEMRDFADRVAWRQALSPTTPYHQLAFRRKEDEAQFPVALDIGLKGMKVGLPSGLSSGQGVGLVLARIAAPYGRMRSFDDLPTPFRCVASDLNSGKGVVFSSGSLFDALRATMSLPALFAPVRLNGMLLVDGALTDNLPVDVVKAMGADYTIAVALDLPSDAADFESLLGVAGRSISYMIAEKERTQMAAADVVVMPLLKGMTAADYSKWEDFRRIGYEAAQQKAAMLMRFQVSDQEYRAYAEARRGKQLPTVSHPQEVRVTGDVAPRLEVALKKAVLPVPGEAIDQARLEEQMLKLTGTGRFATAGYDFFKEDGRDILQIRLAEREYGPPFLKPAIFIDGASGEGMRFGIGGRLTFLDFGGPASEWRTDAAIGTYNVLATEWYYRIQGGKWFVAPRAGFEQRELRLYNSQGEKTTDYDRIIYDGGADLGYAFGRFKEFRIGYEFGHLETLLDAGAIGTHPLSGPYRVTRAIFRRDSRNGPLVPTRGTFLDLQAGWYDRYPGVRRGFPAYEGTVQRAFSFNPRYSMRLLAAGGSTVREGSLENFFDVGGLYRVSSLARGQLLGNNYYLGSAYIRRAFSVESISLFAKFYGVIGYEAGRAWQPEGTIRPRQDGIIGLLGATRIGVVFLGASVGDQARLRFCSGWAEPSRSGETCVVLAFQPEDALKFAAASPLGAPIFDTFIEPEPPQRHHLS